MKLLIVDNYDSFTFNLYQLAAEVFDELPVVVPNDSLFEEIAGQGFDAVIISPGPGTPAKDADFGISKNVICEMNVPILGVCLGHQGMCHWMGGSVVHAPLPMHGREQQVRHMSEGLFENIPDPFVAVRYHSLVVSEPLPGCFERTAWTPDGLIMAVAHKERPMWGVQFHPESICSTFGRQLMENFYRMAKEFHGLSPTSKREQPAPSEKLSSLANSASQNPNVVETFVRRLAAQQTAEQVFERAFAHHTYAFWLDSSLTRESDGRFSFLGGYDSHEAECVRYYAHSRRVAVQHDGIQELINEDLFPYLNRRLAQTKRTGPELPFDFDGGFVGYFGYELKAVCGAHPAHRAPHPDCYGVLAKRFVAFDHISGEVYLVFLGDRSAEKEAAAWFRHIEDRIGNETLGRPPEASEAADLIRFDPLQSESTYLKNITNSLAAINDGETYEVCLTNQLSAATTLDAFDYYRQLRRRNPAPYSAFLKFPDLSVACSSPERFLKIDHNSMVEAKPIKGTSRRSADPLEDELLKRSLSTDEKSRSENLMIVDLLRNDLGRVCSIGSVHVPKLMHVETCATVHQLVSTVRGQLNKSQTSVDCLQSAFPGGSMTGAPKIRTMEIIDQLEGSPRGIYSGSIGHLAFNGRSDLNIVIRTAVFSKKSVSIGVGGAIIALSDPQEEWDEILLKAEALLGTFKEFYKTVLLMNRRVETYGNTISRLFLGFGAAG